MNIDSVMYGGIEINDDKKVYIDEEVSTPKDLRYAKVIFVPEIGENTDIPPLNLAYKLVKFEAEKVAFKYGQEDHWEYYYGMLSDTIKHGCDENGKPAVLVIMPYSTMNEELAKTELIKYVSEINMLCGIERSVLYFNLSTAIEIVSHFSNSKNKCMDTYESFETIDHTITKNISCTIESTIQGAAKFMQIAIGNNSKDMTPSGMLYLETGAFFYSKAIMNTNCLMFAPAVMQCNHEKVHTWPNGDLFEKSVYHALSNSKLFFKNYTVL